MAESSRLRLWPTYVVSGLTLCFVESKRSAEGRPKSRKVAFYLHFAVTVHAAPLLRFEI
jgi:hypothetical protein